MKCTVCGSDLPADKTNYCTDVCRQKAKTERWVERQRAKGVVVVPKRTPPAAEGNAMTWRRWRQ